MTATIEYSVLKDNVGFIQIPHFSDRGDGYLARFDTAMRELASTDAMILDLRDNCGGGAREVRHVSTYFFPKDTHLASTENRGRPVQERWTLDNVPGPRFLDKPLYILVNSGTFSAGESFTFGMSAVTGRAQVVGKRTGGGGHFGGWRRATEEFSLWVPVGRTFNPHTGIGWEAEGIAPDIESTSEGALEAALSAFRKGFL